MEKGIWLLGLLALSAGLLQAEGQLAWQHFDYPADGFSIDFPGEPKASSYVWAASVKNFSFYPYEPGQKKVNLTFENTDPQMAAIKKVFTVGYSDLPKGKKWTVKDISKLVQREYELMSQEFSQRNAILPSDQQKVFHKIKLSKRRFFKYEGSDAYEYIQNITVINVSLPQSSEIGYHRILIIHGREYILTYSTKLANDSLENGLRFFDSFHVKGTKRMEK